MGKYSIIILLKQISISEKTLKDQIEIISIFTLTMYQSFQSVWQPCDNLWQPQTGCAPSVYQGCVNLTTFFEKNHSRRKNDNGGDRNPKAYWRIIPYAIAVSEGGSCPPRSLSNSLTLLLAIFLKWHKANGLFSTWVLPCQKQSRLCEQGDGSCVHSTYYNILQIIQTKNEHRNRPPCSLSPALIAIFYWQVLLIRWWPNVLK